MATSGLCAEFVNGWRSGARPTIETLLDQVDPADRSVLLLRLIALEVEFRRARGEVPATEEYAARFPDHSALIGAALLDTDQTSQFYESTREFPPGSPPDPDADFEIPGEPSPHHFGDESGDPLSRFRRIELLGRGGFGEVWRVRDSRLGRDAALKIPRPDKTFPPEVHRKFLAEARKIAALDNIPGIVRVFDVGTIDAGFYIVMQLIEGETLAVRLSDAARPRLTQRESAQLIAEVAAALDDVHRHKDNITHRDLKPQNILLDLKGRPHITDFGLAVSESEQLEERPTQQGTRAYLSPEQARFESHLVDGRSDIFSLGIIFYQLLCGVRPFNGRTDEECLQAILHCEPRPLRARDAVIPRELERICLKCLEKKKVDRYLTAGDLVYDLQAWLNSAGKPPTSEVERAAATSPVSGKGTRYGLAMALGGGALALMLAAYSLTHPRTDPPKGSGDGGRGGHYGQLNPLVSPVPVSRAEQEFIDTFGQPPKKMPYEGSRGVGSFKFIDEPTLRALAVESETVTLIELCEMPAGDFEFAINLRQSNWTGRVGICLGKHLEAHGDKHLSCDTFQLLRLQIQPAIPDLSPLVFRVERQKVYIDSPNRIPQTFADLELGTQLVAPLWEAEPPRLEFTVHNHRLARVAWNNMELKELSADVWESKLTPEDYQGPLGIYVENASVWCSKPVFRLLSDGESK